MRHKPGFVVYLHRTRVTSHTSKVFWHLPEMKFELFDLMADPIKPVLP